MFLRGTRGCVRFLSSLSLPLESELKTAYRQPEDPNAIKVQASESFDLLVEIEEGIQPKWFAGLHTKATEVLTPVSVVNALIGHQNQAEEESEVEEAKAKAEAEAETGFEALQTHQHTGHKHRA